MFTRSLAYALRSKGIILNRLGSHREALSAATESISLLRDCEEKWSLAIADAHGRLAQCHAAIGNFPCAIAETQHEIAYYRRHAKANDAAVFELAHSMENLSDYLEQAGLASDSFNISKQALRTLVPLLSKSSKSIVQFFDLFFKASKRAEQRCLDKEALALSKEVVRRVRPIVSATNNKDIKFLLATAERLLGQQLSRVNKIQFALRATAEAVKYLTEIATESPDGLEPYLSACLYDHGICLAKLLRRREALQALESAALMASKCYDGRKTDHLKETFEIMCDDYVTFCMWTRHPPRRDGQLLSQTIISRAFRPLCSHQLLRLGL
jgi:tetratricopeptide (TPR) repeat protein